MPSRRRERVSGLLLQTLAEILLREVKDPRVAGVTLTDATISPDLKIAKVFFTTFREEDRSATLAGLQSAAGYMKHQLASRMRLRHTPELHFLYDTTLEQAHRLEHLLRQVNEKEQ
jgi:ribosome-binding factor A